MKSSTLFILLTVFLIALSLSVSVANAGEEEKGEKKEEGKEGKGGEEKGEGKEEEEKEKGGEKDKKEDKSGAFSIINGSGLSTALSLALACLVISLH